MNAIIERFIPSKERVAVFTKSNERYIAFKKLKKTQWGL